VKVTVSAQISHLLAFLRRMGCRGHDEKSLCASAAQAHMLQHIAALFFRQIDIQNDQSGKRRVASEP
jgi:hypothetical protein